MKRWNTNAFEYELSCILKQQHAKSNLNVFKACYIVKVGWEACDLWLNYNWFNQNIKIVSTIEFEIKS
jgi:hypothetical protein